eukprot:TRINITY_DN2064_c0_g1_i5.p1 TRINITY_DN2064_c0_g1~~TRINITY_DN2064_c0_g1_i5.p1  ORF type:complete len:133 (-),score=50.80 TRINITY_DN2064_c0_g1_i5:240-638(-)
MGEIDGLVDELVQKIENFDNNTKYFIGIGGSPGSGKTTFSKKLCERLNGRIENVAVLLPQDGYHYSKEYLSNMEEPEVMLKRRGSEFTFDSGALLNKIVEIKDNNQAFAPDFQHDIGDPIENAIEIKSGYVP